MGMQAGGSGGFQSEINVTPMVDIMLVILIIFMVITPFLQQGITVAIPRDLNNPEVDPAIIKESSVVVSIPEDNEFYIGKERIDKDSLKSEIESRMKDKQGDERIVYIKSGVGVSYGNVVEVINLIRQAGVDQIGLVADRKKKGGTEAGAPQ
ncbi:MAG: biopolymer transporter ExbD [Pyrinomonas sp.]|uniref:ExbD/TolR family protein n=1 Tax=Pyrinomonas sp. TaxID=2080306 RepID=UPI003318E15B